jgi:putative ABC transport system permease protein
VIAAAVGTVAGRLVSVSLISAVSKLYGIGAGIGRPPSTGALVVTIVLAVSAAAVAGILPFRPAGRVPTVAVLGP